MLCKLCANTLLSVTFEQQVAMIKSVTYYSAAEMYLMPTEIWGLCR